MADNQHIRSEMLIGKEALTKLQKAKVAVCGLGGVGSYAAESLARSGVGKLLLIDADTLSLSNLNRQLPALHSTLHQSKVEVMAGRFYDINPTIKIEKQALFLDAQTPAELFAGCDYIVDAVDTVSAKIRLAEIAEKLHIPIISAMGCGNKTDPQKLVVTDLYKTETCPLCRVMRRECKKRGIQKLTVVYSTEAPVIPKVQEEIKEGTRPAPASMIFVPATAGLLMGAKVVEELIQ